MTRTATGTQMGTLDLEQTTRVFRNLTAACYSLQQRRPNPSGSQTFYTVQHATGLLLRDASFTVQAGGRARVRREGKKYVHAFVTGDVLAVDATDVVRAQDPRYYWRTVRYNPHRDDVFVVNMGYDDAPVWTPIRGADEVLFTPHGVWAHFPTVNIEGAVAALVARRG